MQATARMASAVSSTFSARWRLIRIVRSRNYDDGTMLKLRRDEVRGPLPVPQMRGCVHWEYGIGYRVQRPPRSC